MEVPETRYVARPDGINIAYQVVGDADLDLLVAPGFISHLDLQWSDPTFAYYLRRLAGFARLILYDKPGTGVSDPVAHVPTLEERMADISLVLEAAGSSEPALLGVSEGGPAAALFAATYPERTRALVLVGTFTRLDLDDPSAPARVAQMNDVLEHWGDGHRLCELFAPSANPLQRRLLGRFARAAASPAMARALIAAIAQVDARATLPAIDVPTLVVHRTDDRAIGVAEGRAMAAAIPGQLHHPRPGEDHVPWAGDVDGLVDEVEAFLTGSTRGRKPERALATVLFTDICGSTERAGELGDAAWREVLGRHDALTRDRVEAFGGRVVKSLGDGTLATFDGPARAVRCARALSEEIRELGIELRAGLHTGEVELLGDDVAGMAVHLGARVSAQAGPGEVLVSSTVKDLVVGSELAFADRGEHELKGVPGRWRIHAVADEAAPRPEPLDAAADHMRIGDRVAVRMARRAPRAMRAFGRLAQRT